MPTPNRVSWVKHKTRLDFRKHQHLTDMEEIELHLVVGETNLDSVEIQAAHLTKLFTGTDWIAEANRAYQPPPGTAGARAVASMKPERERWRALLTVTSRT